MKRPMWRIAVFGLMAFSLYLFVLVPVVQGITAPNEIVLTPSEYAVLREQNNDVATGNETDTPKTITIKLFGLIPIKQVMVNILPFDTIIVGGIPVGICGEIDGLLVTEDVADRSLLQGDIIKNVAGVDVQTLADYARVSAGRNQTRVNLCRKGKNLSKTVDLSQIIHLRDNTDGVGMLTFVNPEDQTFSALGHQMTDFATGAAVDLCGGTLRSVNTHGVVKTQGTDTGVIQSSIRTNTAPQGSITHGTAFGVAGCLNPDSTILQTMNTTMPVATRYTVKPGKASLRTCLDGTTVEEFSCEILKTRYQHDKGDKSMVIRITDPRLLARTGGIVHGMSGSPIIQNGHLVGALTHAMTHDAAKGYAVYIDFVAR